MLEAMFSFRGRIGRLRYFLSSSGLVAALVILVLVLFGASLRSRAPGTIPAIGPAALLLLPIVVAVIWSSLSLQVRRFRDIGWNPTLMIGVWFAIEVVDKIIAHSTPSLAFGALHQQTLLGSLANLALGGSLLFWPGSAGDDFSARADFMPVDSAPPRPAPRPAAAPPPSAPRPSPAPAPAARAAPAQPAFGRRGL